MNTDKNAGGNPGKNYSYPLTFSERQMATEQGMNPESVAYNIRLGFLLKGELDVLRLEVSLAELVKRHRILRSYYPFIDGEYVHKIDDDIKTWLIRRSCAPDEAEPFIYEMNTPYDLSKAPLFRFVLFDTGDGCHVLHIGLHHIIADGTSYGALVKELWGIYNGDVQDSREEPDYLDYALHLEENEEFKEQLEFFEKMFEGGLPENEMPITYSRPEVLPFAEECVESLLDARLIETYAKKCGVTVFTLLFAAAGILTAKYCGSEDVVLGTAMSGRSKEVKNTVGMFVNTLPVRLRPLGSMKLSSYIDETSSMLREVKKRQTSPIERLVPHFAPERNSSRGALFDVIVNYLTDFEIPPVRGLTVSRLPLKGLSLATDIKLEMLKMGDNIRVRFGYSGELYAKEVIEGMSGLFSAIVERITSGRDMTVGDTGEITDGERNRILNDFSGLRTDEGLRGTIIDLFRETARLKPDNQAVAFMGKAMTYAELDALTDRVAELLVKKGVSRGGCVGILIRRTQMMVTGALGVLKSGAAYVPLDPTYPVERLEFMLKDSNAQIVIADSDFISMISNYNGKYITSDEIIALREFKEGGQGELASLAGVGAEPQDLFVLLYTSGTTGKPKGVMLSHANLMNFCAWYRRYYELTDSDRVAAYASFGFDASLMDLYPALTTGACVHIIPEEMRLDLPALNDYFNKNGVSVSFMTTQLGRQFAQDMKNTSLRALSVGGETLVPLEPPKGFAFYNCYGPTECTVFTTTFKLDRLYERAPLGKPLDNTDIYIVDRGGRLAPIGVQGELCVAGRQVAMGYLGHPGLTAEKFVPNPFRSDTGYDRMYRTGDVARFLPDGKLDFIGRSDFQVKIRGFRVELPEIEGRIRQHPAVKDAAVVALDAPGGGKCAVAYIVSEPKIDVPQLNAFIEEVLPPYMVPAATVHLDKIPLNPNGKVDRRRLPVPEFGGEESSQGKEDVSRSLTALQVSISKAVAEVLGHDNFGAGSNLIRAGLASLSAIKLTSKLNDAFGVAPKVRDIMKEPTVLGIENLIVQKFIEVMKHPAEQEIKPDEPLRSSYPLTAGQMGVFFECMKRPGTLVYNMPMKFVFSDAIDAERLAGAVKTVIDAHASLKSRIVMEGDGAVQMPLDAAADVESLEMTEEEFESLCKAFARPFDLFKGPLYRMTVVRTQGSVALLADFHHIAFDGASLDIFMRELSAAYGGEAIKSEEMTLFDSALIEAKAVGGKEWMEDKAYFDALLADCEGASDIEGDLPAQEGAGALAFRERPVDRAAAERFCREQGVTPAGLFLGAFSYAVARWTCGRDVYISTISNGRGDHRLSRSFGMFVRTLPLHVKLGDSSSSDFIRTTGESLNKTIAHEGYPFFKIAEEHSFEPNIMYICQLGVTENRTVGGEAAERRWLKMEEPKFDLQLTVEERGGESLLVVGYNDARYSVGFAERILDTVATALDNIIASPEAPIRSVSLVSKEQKKLLEGFNRTDDPIGHTVIHHMFEDAVKKHPSKIALMASDRDYTFEQLDEEANRLANALLALGAGREDRIAFMLRRTGRIPVAMLGIAKAGCAWIPVDPNYPEERVEHVLSDSGAKYLLTTADIKAERFNGALDIDELRMGQSRARPDVAVMPDQLALIIYTSGSTGKPKGVMLEHRGITNYITAHPLNPHTMALVRDARVMMSITTVAFDMFMIESLMSMCNGLTMVLADDDTTKDPTKLAELFERTGADAFDSTPSRFMEFTECPDFLRAIRSCKVVSTGGEKFPPALQTRLHGDGSKVKIFNIYGPTEISVACNGKEIKGAGRITTGAPFLGVREYVVDIDGNILPCSVVGEILVGGRGVGRGYINLPKQTEERFIMFNDERVYKTGDLGRWTEDGEIEILGRNDNQIKLRGLRIELGEIEKAITAVSGVKSCAAMIKKIHAQDHICAWFTASRVIEAEELRRELARTLVPYMLPTAYMQIDAMPKTPNGKDDLRALPEPQLCRSGDYAAPVTPLEEAFCSIYEKILGASRIGAEDSFFDIGGSSLAVTRVVIEARERGISRADGTGIAYGDVFAHPTPRALAGLIEGGSEPPAVQSDESDYDYTEIDRLLALGTIDVFVRGERSEPGNALLTGATGFLGIHVLRDFIQSSSGCIYCLMRRGSYDSLEARLKNMLYYYFEEDFEELFGSRIFTVEGDITNKESLDSSAHLPIDTIINCAANVTHFASDSAISDVNTGGVLNLMDLAMKMRARLVHVSTYSVAGYRVLSERNDRASVPVMDESMLYFGQNLENQYIHSKFLAERAILESIPKGLDAKIMRVGNLMARSRDGEFQVNLRANNFVSRLMAYSAIGCFPWSAYLKRAELSPIDSTASAILTLLDSPRECTVFHPYTNRTLLFGDIITAMREESLKIEFVDDDVFERAMSAAMKNPKRAERITSLIAYQNAAQGRSVTLIETKNDYTTQALLRRGWRWPRPSEDYLGKFIRGLIGLGLFDE